MLRDGRNLALLLLLMAVGCGAERGEIYPSRQPDAATPEPTGSGGAPEIPEPGSGGATVDPGTGGAGGDGSGGTGGDPMPPGTGGTVVVQDAGMDVGAPDVPVGTDAAATGPFECSQLIGLFVATQWWGTFEAALDSTRWQYTAQTNAYIEKWADPASTMWDATPLSPCATRSKNPDRVLLIAFSTALKTLEDYRLNITKAVNTTQLKYPGVKRIELLTTLRAAGNTLCPGKDPYTVVPAYVDQAIQDVADNFKSLVTVGPKVEIANCAWWEDISPDLHADGAVAAGQAYAAYYKAHP